MSTKNLQRESISLFDEYVDTFKREEFPFTMFGKMDGKRGILFDLPFAGACSMLVLLIENDMNTVYGYLFDIIPYRNLSEGIIDKIMQVVKTNMKQISLLYDENMQRFVIPVELSRDLGRDIRFLFSTIGERILMCYVPPSIGLVKEGTVLYDALQTVVKRDTYLAEAVTTKIEQPLIDEFEVALRENGYIFHKENQDNGTTNLVYLVSHKGTREGVMMSEAENNSVIAYITYPLDFSGIPNHFVDQIVREIQERVNTGLGHVMYVAELGAVHYLHHFYRNHFYPYEDLGAQLISLFEQEVELALDVFKETAKKYGLDT